MRMLVMTVKACVLLAAAPYLVADAKTTHPTKTEQTITTKAKVDSVNQATREVTLTRADGSKVTIKVPDTVKNLAQVKPGDTVKAKYTESVALDIRSANEAPSARQTETLKRAPLGGTPQGEQTVSTQITANIEKIDKKKREVTLLQPDGSVTSVV